MGDDRPPFSSGLNRRFPSITFNDVAASIIFSSEIWNESFPTRGGGAF